MWVRRADYAELIEKRVHAEGEKDAMRRQVEMQKTHLDWMTLRLTQLEHERASLIHRYMGIAITVPTVELDVPVTPPASSSALSDVPSFDDVGDEEAKKLGLDWDSQGRVTQHGKVLG